MDSKIREFIEYQCEQLGGLARANVEYSNGEERRFLVGFDCDRAADCGIRRSAFSGNFNYPVDCPIYFALAIKLMYSQPIFISPQNPSPKEDLLLPPNNP